jgi:plasmid replication initiation protein
VGQFKQFVLDKAIKEIRKNCWVEITYRNKKRGRSIDGFYFTAKSIWGSMTDDELPHRLRKRLRLHDLKAKTKTGSISPEEFDELQELILELGQLSLEDIMNNYPLDD